MSAIVLQPMPNCLSANCFPLFFIRDNDALDAVSLEQLNNNIQATLRTTGLEC